MSNKHYSSPYQNGFQNMRKQGSCKADVDIKASRIEEYRRQLETNGEIEFHARPELNITERGKRQK